MLYASIVYTLAGCTATNTSLGETPFWAKVQSNQAYLYTKASLTSVVYKEIKKGSILYFHRSHGNFQEVYTRDFKGVDPSLRGNFRYFLHQPSYTRLDNKYQKHLGVVYEIPFDLNNEYTTGERGGCYYINRNGNKTYVDHSYCGVSSWTTTNAQKRTPTTKCISVQCSGRTQKGLRCRNRTTNCSGRCHLH